MKKAMYFMRLVFLVCLMIFLNKESYSQTPARTKAITTIQDSLPDNNTKAITPSRLRYTLYRMLDATKDSVPIIDMINLQKNTPNGLAGLDGAGKILTSQLPDETDPTVPGWVKAITQTDTSNWHQAFRWGNHASAGYLVPIITSPSEGQVLKYISGAWRNSSASNSPDSTIAANGLYMVGKQVKLGGPLIEQTKVGNGSERLDFDVARTLYQVLDTLVLRSNATGAQIALMPNQISVNGNFLIQDNLYVFNKADFGSSSQPMKIPVTAGESLVGVSNGDMLYNSTLNKFRVYEAGAWRSLSGGNLNSVTGTSNRIAISGTSSDPIVDISGTYVGQASINTLGTVTTGVWNSTVISPTFGGTGQSTVTTGDLLYGSGSNTWGKLAAASTGNVLLSGTTPSWGKVGLTTHVSGILPVANGGTGTSTPGLVGGTGIDITGTWPNQTITATGGGGGGPDSTTAINVGSGVGIYKTENINELQFKSITTPGSVTATSNTNDVALQLQGDNASPGNNMVYGTNNSGTKGFQQATVINLTSPVNGQILVYQDGEWVNTNNVSTNLETQITFRVGLDPAMSAGDSVYVDTTLIGKMVKVYREGERMYLDTIYGIESDTSTGTIIFHPYLSNTEKIIIEALNFSTSAPSPPSGLLEDLDFPTQVDLTNTGTTWECTNSASLFAGYGLCNKKLGSGQNGYIRARYTTSDGNAAVIAFNTSNSNQPYLTGGTTYNYEAGAFLSGGTLYYLDNNTGATSTGATLSVGDYWRVIRTGSVLKLQTSPDATAWTDRHTYTFSSSADLFININVDLNTGANKLYEPKGFNLQ